MEIRPIKFLSEKNFSDSMQKKQVMRIIVSTIRAIRKVLTSERAVCMPFLITAEFLIRWRSQKRLMKRNISELKWKRWHYLFTINPFFSDSWTIILLSLFAFRFLCVCLYIQLTVCQRLELFVGCDRIRTDWTGVVSFVILFLTN